MHGILHPSAFYIFTILNAVLVSSCAHHKDGDVVYFGDTNREIGPVNFEVASKRVAKGDARTAFYLGCDFADRGQIDQALRWLRIASIMGDSEAQHVFYIYSQPMDKLDSASQLEAKLWLQEACKHNYKGALETKRARLELGLGNTVLR